MCVASCSNLLEAEEARRNSVDGRLTTIVGLSSLSGTIVLGAMFTSHSGQRAEVIVLSCGLLYLAGVYWEGPEQKAK